MDEKVGRYVTFTDSCVLYVYDGRCHEYSQGRSQIWNLD